MKKLQIVLAAALAIASLAGCQPQSGSLIQPEEITASQVVVAISTEPEHGFDPCLGWGHGSTPLVQSALMKYTEGRQIVGDLATGYTISEDGTQWEISLRQDATFTDGVAVTAQDVAFTFRTAKDSQSTLDLTNLMQCDAVDDYTVRFVLAAPNSTFLHTLASVGIVPEHDYGPDYANNPIGSGPWKFVQWNKGEQVILEANEGYYGQVPAIQRAVLVFMEEDAAFAAAQAGKVDVALTSATHATRDIPGMTLHSITTMDNRGMTLPVQPDTGRTTEGGSPIGNNVTADRAIRQALAYGIDRQRIADDAVGGFADPAYSENDGMPWNSPAVRLDTDVAKAKQLLADAGWVDADGDGIVEKDGIPAQFTCLYPSGDSVRQAVALAAAAQAKELGIAITVEGTSWDDISKNMFRHAVLMGWGSVNPYTSYLLYHSANGLRDDYYNPEGYDSNVVDSYLDQALQAPTDTAANELWRKAQWDGQTGTAMQGDCPWVWLVNIQHLYYVRDGLDIGQQQLHPHGASWSLVENLQDWQYIPA